MKEMIQTLTSKYSVLKERIQLQSEDFVSPAVQNQLNKLENQVLNMQSHQCMCKDNQSTLMEQVLKLQESQTITLKKFKDEPDSNYESHQEKEDTDFKVMQNKEEKLSQESENGP